MDLIMNFREKLKKTAPHHPQKKTLKKKERKERKKNKNKNKNTAWKTQEKQQQTKQAENCESLYWHTQITGNFKGPRLSKKG